MMDQTTKTTTTVDLALRKPPSTSLTPRKTERRREFRQRKKELNKRESLRLKLKLKRPEMLWLVRTLVSSNKPSSVLSKITKRRLLNSLQKMHPATVTKKSLRDSEELTKLPRLPRPTS
jgi:hypothetical protein